MYYTFQNETLLVSDRAENLASYGEVIEFAGATEDEFCQNQDRFEVVDGALVDISETEKYKKAQEEVAAKRRTSEIAAEMDKLDAKSVRCIRAINSGALSEGELVREKTLLAEIETKICELRTELNAINN